MTKYTAADFANAKFAEHPDGRRAVRLSTKQEQPWRAEAFTEMEIPFGVFYVTDRGLAQGGWVPVPTKPTITESRFMELVEVCSFADGPASYREFCRLAGIEIAPDPEPTNTDRLEKLIISAPGNFEGVEAILKRPANVRAWAEYLNDHGVTVPNVKDN